MPTRSRKKAKPPGDGRRIRLKPKDSFDLIRLLARSQSDARKAVCELVQNSLDAGARRVELTWFNEKGQRALRIRDDGRGIFPQLERADALQRIASTIGHSHKQNLGPAERHEQMVLGKYGIGLLGFWCVAHSMEIKSRVGGGELWCLRLEEDQPDAEVRRARAGRLDDEATFTQITLRQVKPAVQRQIRPARLQAYLAGELRGQLLEREVELRIHDRVARGRAVKEFVVRAQPYLGQLLDDLRELAIEGHESARLELYLVPADEERHGCVALACGGTTVLDDIARIEPGEEPRAPWRSGRLEGVIDFPELAVSPSTRRGFVPDEAAAAFLRALESLEATLRERLSEEERARAEQHQQRLAGEIRRAFQAIAAHLPQYDLFDVDSSEVRKGQAGGAAATEGAGVEGAGADGEGASLEPRLDALEPEAEPGTDPEEEAAAEPALFPPGPLASVRLSPARLTTAPGSRRAFRARALDADGRPAAGEVAWSWSLEGAGALAASGPEATYGAPAGPAEARVTVTATQGGFACEASARVLVRLGAADRGRTAGIPEPHPVNAPSEPWRSRMRGERWEYNEGHRDHVAVSGEPARRLRYLTHLFAKEVVLKNFASPADAELLERLVEVITWLDAGRRR